MRPRVMRPRVTMKCYQVEATFVSLTRNDSYVFDALDDIFVFHGISSSPFAKANPNPNPNPNP